MKEQDEIKIYIEELRQTGHLILTYTDKYGKLYLLKMDDKQYNLDEEAQLRAQIELLEKAIDNIKYLPNN